MKEALGKLYLKTKAASGNLSFSADEISVFLGGRVIGDGKVRIKRMETADFAADGDITFAFSEEDLKDLSRTRASCILTTVKSERHPKTLIIVDDMKKAMTIMYNVMLELLPPSRGEVHPGALVSPGAKIGKETAIGPNAVVEEGAVIGDNTSIGANSYIGRDVYIGKSCAIYPNVSIMSRTRIGDKVIIHSGVVLGADGFGFVPKDGKVYKVPQIGNVVVGDNVEIGANTCVDKGTFTRTEIGSGTKLDNLVQVGHNVKIGRNVLIAAQTGIGGSTVIGNDVMMGGQVGVSDHSVIGNNVKIAAKAGVAGRIQDNKVLFGFPAREPLYAKQLHGVMTTLIKYRRELKDFLRKLPKIDDKNKEGSEGGGTS